MDPSHGMSFGFSCKKPFVDDRGVSPLLFYLESSGRSAFQLLSHRAASPVRTYLAPRSWGRPRQSIDLVSARTFDQFPGAKYGFAQKDSLILISQVSTRSGTSAARIVSSRSILSSDCRSQGSIQRLLISCLLISWLT